MILQKIIITLFLIIIYFAGFGLTLVFVLLFKHDVLAGESGNNTAWIDAEGYEPDIIDAARQS